MEEIDKHKIKDKAGEYIRNEMDKSNIRLMRISFIAFSFVFASLLLFNLLTKSALYSFTNWAYGLICLISLVFYFIIRDGHYKFSAYILILFTWGIMMTFIWLNKSIYNIGNIANLVLILFGVLIISRRFALIIAIGSLVNFLILSFLIINKNIQPFVPSAFNMARDYTAIIASTIALIIMYESSMRKAVYRIADLLIQKEQDQKKIHEYEHSYSEIFEAMNDAIVIQSTDDLRIIDFNLSACLMFGYQKSEFLHLNIEALSATEEGYTSERVGEKITEAIQNDYTSFEWKAKRANGNVFWALIDLKTFIINERILLINVIRDIDKTKKAEEEIKAFNDKLEQKIKERTFQLEQANKDIETFAYSISHDLRTPLRHIQGFTNLLYSEVAEKNEQIEDYYRKIRNSSKRMSDMIEDLLHFSRTGRKDLQVSIVNLNTILKDIIDTIINEERERKIEWKVSDLPLIKADRSQIKLVFENLLSNAIKYTSKKEIAIIEIGYSIKNDNQIEIFVSDNGVGFDMAQSERLFGVFQRLHTLDDFEGTGIGLANVKQIINKHQGSVYAKGEVGKGATFYITLPKDLKVS